MADLHLQFSRDEVAALAGKIRELECGFPRKNALCCSPFSPLRPPVWSLLR